MCPERVPLKPQLQDKEELLSYRSYIISQNGYYTYMSCLLNILDFRYQR